MLAKPLPRLLVFPLVTSLLVAAGCGGGGGGSGSTPVTVELTGDPTVEYDAVRGRTVVVTQFTARRDDGVPVTPEEVRVTMEVDGTAVDNESILQESARELAASLHYYLVLDASGSMLQHDPPAFAPMKEAARRSVEAGIAAWTTRPGIFSWDVTWFNDVLFHRRGLWSPDDIASLPEPPLDAATKLYAAVEQAAAEMLIAYQQGTANGLRDHHVMVVLSDGADNLSDFDNQQAVPTTIGSTASGGAYERFGWPATALADAVAAITAHPAITVHVLAMGSEFAPADLDNLRVLSEAGSGQLLVNPKASEVDALFDRVTREFTTVQTAGAAIPQQGGDHELTLVVEGTAFHGEGRLSFAYHAGPGAQLLLAP